MNIALPAVLIFIILLPGFALRSRFKRVERSSFDFSPFGQVVTEAVLLAALLHASWLTMAFIVFGRVLDTSTLLALLSSDAVSQRGAFKVLSTTQGWVGAYFGTLLAFSFYAPTLARGAITRWKLDRVGAKFSPLLRFHQAPWYYLLTGADFERGDEPDLILISAIVDTKADQPMLYMGVLDEYFVNMDGELDRLVLSDVLRRPLDSDRTDLKDPSLSRFYPVEGDYFVLRYSEAITLNIRYVKLNPVGGLQPGT